MLFGRELEDEVEAACWVLLLLRGWAAGGTDGAVNCSLDDRGVVIEADAGRGVTYKQSKNKMLHTLCLKMI